MEVVSMLATEPEVGHPTWRPPKPEILRSQLADEIETKFQRLYACFQGPATQGK
jgi:hypothetical protein